jgi:hypothetical protein
MKKIPTLCILVALQLISLAPLVIYPAVLLASIMGLAGHRTGDEPPRVLFVAYSFYILTIVYPVPTLACSFLAWWTFAKCDGKWSVVLAALPVLLLAAIMWLFMSFLK